nr:MAG TPA: hypothetical protein [Caudoviricetes sp.]
MNIGVVGRVLEHLCLRHFHGDTPASGNRGRGRLTVQRRQAIRVLFISRSWRRRGCAVEAACFLPPGFRRLQLA